MPENQFTCFFGLAHCCLLLRCALTTHLSGAFPSLAVITVLVKKKKKSEQFSQVSPGTTGHLGPPQTPHAATTITPPQSLPPHHITTPLLKHWSVDINILSSKKKTPLHYFMIISKRSVSKRTLLEFYH